MNIIIPMMGVGQRFKDAGYLSSKPAIQAFGKEILFWLLDCLDCNNNNVMIVCRSDLESDRLVEKIKSKYHDSVSFLILNENTQGAAHTVRLALESGSIDLDEKFAICDSDTFYDETHIAQMQLSKNAVFYFEDQGDTPIYSYLYVKDDKVIEIAEKRKISNFASVGTYCFESGNAFIHHAKKVMDEKKTTKGEYYVSVVVQSMIDEGMHFEPKKVKSFTCLGTPSQLQGFTPNKKLRICFDIDNTLVSYPRIPGDYTSVDPINKNIDFLRYLKSCGHTIILHTARRMATHSGNVGKLLADIGKITFETLEKFEIPFDEIHFGKPHADFYIDDKSVNAFDDLEKQTGVYQNELISRDHNRLICETNAITKSSSKNSIKGELYWYLHSPQEFRRFLPELISHSQHEDVTTLQLERIDGPTFSKMLTIGSLQQHHMKDLLQCLSTLHKSPLENSDVDVYANYLPKLDERYFSFDDMKSKRTDEIYARIRNFLHEYKQKKLAAPANIHGDPVFTNALIDKDNRIKLIDMRGLLGEIFTITGDRNYDYAKVYQSLVGYDFLIRDRKIEEQKLRNLRSFFVRNIEIDENVVSGLTASLLFTCIPLQPRSVRKEILELAEKCIACSSF